MDPIANFQDINNFLTQLQSKKRKDYSLDNIKLLMDSLVNPQDKFKAIHIAGTSGKTSTAYFMSALLQSANQTVGLTVSPTMDEINERLQINLAPLKEEQFVEAFREFVNVLSNMTFLSWFEFMITFVYWYLGNNQIDYGVIEVGLGGLKDPTNVIGRSDKICLITDIGYDHLVSLGNSFKEIAYQKAGIIMPGNEVFMHSQDEEIMQVVKDKADQVRASLHIVPAKPNLSPDIADYQHRNWELAYAAYKFLMKRDGLVKLTQEQLQRAHRIQVPGRMEIKRVDGKTIILDSAHNSQKMAAFASSFNNLYPGIKPTVLIKLKSSKDHLKVARIVSEIADKVIITETNVLLRGKTKILPGRELMTAFGSTKLEIEENARLAVERFLESSEEYLVITGSIYLLSQLRKTLPYLK